MWKKSSINIQCLFVEKNPHLYSKLNADVGQLPRTKCVNDDFLNVIPFIIKESATKTVFLYLDPFTVQGLEWAPLARVFGALEKSRSIELLLNLNVQSFCRRAISALALEMPVASDSYSVVEDEINIESLTLDQLNRVAGGDWWIRPLRDDKKLYSEKLDLILQGFVDRLREYFAEVCVYNVKQLDRLLPKYALVFASRHPLALKFMNDAMIQARDMQADIEAPKDGSLFETRSELLVPDLGRLPQLVLLHAVGSQRREELVAKIIRAAFCQFTAGQIAAAIAELAEKDELRFTSATNRLNDDAIVSRALK